MRDKISVLLSGLLVIACSSFAQGSKISLVENSLTEARDFILADSIVPKFNILERMKFYKVPSVSIAIINDGKIEVVKAYGFADIANNKTATTETLYQVASISKSVNALAIMKLVQDGKLSLEKDIRTYLKTWTFPDNDFSKGKTITLKHLLSHTAGLSTSGFMGYAVSESLPTIDQILNGERPANSEAVKPIAFPATSFRYSGGGTTITRKILDDNISPRYDSLLKALVLKPLKMKNSSFSQPPGAENKNVAYAYDFNMQVLTGNYRIYPELAPDGLWTTASDLARFVIAIQESIKGKAGTILDKNLANEMLKPVLDQSNSALGFFISEKGGEKYFSHSGANVGYRCALYGSMTTGKGVIVLTNSDNGNSLNEEIIKSVAQVYGWKDFYAPVVKKLVVVSEDLLDKYVGEYFSEDPKMKISIVRKNNSLELTARRPEKMYAIASDTFFVGSSPNDRCVFSSSRNNGVIDKFEVFQGGNSVIRAFKK